MDFGDGGFGFGDDFDRMASGESKKSKKEKKSKKDRRSAFEDDDFTLTRAEHNTLTFEVGADGGIQADLPGSDDLPVLRNMAIYFDCVRAMDSGVYQEVGGSIAAMYDELSAVRKESCDMEYEVQQKYVEAAEADAERKVVEFKLKDAQARLGSLHTDRRGINVTHLSVGEDRNRIAEEMDFLAKAIEQEEETLLMITRSTGFLETSYREIEAHHKLLENQRVRLLDEVRTEKGKLAEELQTTRAMREEEEKMRLEQKEAIQARVGGAVFRAADAFMHTPLDKGPGGGASGRALAGI